MLENLLDKSEISNKQTQTQSCKHKKLIECTANNNIYALKGSGYVYKEEDVNIKDQMNNTPLFYAA